MAAGGKINHPRSVYGKSKKKGRYVGKKKKQKKEINVDPLTTRHILKKTRTNPNANISLSGKKRRLLLKQLKREEQEKKNMDVEPELKNKGTTSSSVKRSENVEKMDMT